jgi:HEAT repeat protein
MFAATRSPTLLAPGLILGLLICLAPHGHGQAGTGGVSKGTPPLVSPFFPTPGDDGDDDDGPDTGYAPGDSGVPTQNTNDPADVPQPETSVRGTSQRGGGARGETGVAAASNASARDRVRAAGYAVRDSWFMWWETNKFDFIELRRVDDAPLTGQGLVRESSEQRQRRLDEVRQVLDQAVIPSLRELTGSPDAAVRSAAVVALGKLGDAAVVEVAHELLTDGNREVRQSAMLALGVSDMGRAQYALMSIGSDAGYGRKLLERSSLNSEDRGTALLASMLRGDGDFGLVLEALLEESDDAQLQLLAATCEAAGLGRASESIPQLSEIALDDDRPEFIRSAAVSALGRLHDPSVVPVLLQVLDAGGLEPTRAAVVALGLSAHAGHPWAIDRLIDVLEEGRDASARHFAAISLGRLGGEQARAALLDTFRDTSTDMRPWIALGLGLCERSQPDGVVAPLLIGRLAKEANPETAAAYLIALGLCGGPEVVEVLADEARGGQTQRAGQAAVALGLSRQPDALPVLRDVLRSNGSPEVQRRAALGLGILGNSAAVPDLVDLMARTKSPQVAAWAAQGIAFMGDENAVGPLLHVIEKQGPRGVATTYAAAALGQLFDGERRPALSRLASGDNYLARSDAATSLLLLGF